MKVYRVEHKETGIGPYIQDWGTEVEYEDETGDVFTDGGKYRLQKAHEWDGKHPTPWLDFENPPYDWFDFKCGFSSMRQLFAWFGGWLPVVLRHDFRIVVREVPAATVRLGEHQIVYEVSG